MKCMLKCNANYVLLDKNMNNGIKENHDFKFTYETIKNTTVNLF